LLGAPGCGGATRRSGVLEPTSRLVWRASCRARRRPRRAPVIAVRKDFFVLRTHTAGSLGTEQIGQTVTLSGWVDRRRDHGGVAFIDLRDASGVAQVVIRDEAVAHPLRAEYVLQ